jgi:hypothetical protein
MRRLVTNEDIDEFNEELEKAKGVTVKVSFYVNGVKKE